MNKTRTLVLNDFRLLLNKQDLLGPMVYKQNSTSNAEKGIYPRSRKRTMIELCYWRGETIKYSTNDVIRKIFNQC